VVAVAAEAERAAGLFDAQVDAPLADVVVACRAWLGPVDEDGPLVVRQRRASVADRDSDGLRSGRDGDASMGDGFTRSTVDFRGRCSAVHPRSPLRERCSR